MTRDEWLQANPNATAREAFEAGAMCPNARLVCHLRRQGYTPAQIRHVTGLHETTVSRFLRRAGLTHKPTADIPQQIREYLAANGPSTRKAITAALGERAGASVAKNLAGIRVARWLETGAMPSAVYALGTEPSAPRPARRIRSGGLTLQRAWVYTAQR